MTSDSDVVLRSIRRWLLVAVFLLGVGVVTLADIAYIAADYEGGAISAGIGVTGGVIALIAGVKVLTSFSKSE